MPASFKYTIKMVVIKVLLILLLLSILILCFYFFYFLRQPERNIPNNENLFISPANWKIISIIHNPTENEILYKKHKKVMDNFIDWLWEWATMISIMMTPLNVHYQKATNWWILINQEYHPGKKNNAMKKNKDMKSTFQNEYNSMLFEKKDWTRFKIIQIAWKFARRIVPYLKIDDEVEQWDTIWLIKFWSQVTVVFDKNVEIVAKIWDKVIDWETILAKSK